MVRNVVTVVLVVCALFGLLDFLAVYTSAKSVFHELEALVGLLIVAVCAGCLVIASAIDEKPTIHRDDLRKIIEDALDDGDGAER